MHKYFGTDGIRGVFDEGLLTKKFIEKLAIALQLFFNNYNNDVIIGRDTRYSCNQVFHWLSDIILKMGCNIQDCGVITTPGLAFYTNNVKISYGIMISASHNSYYYNGVKIFNNKGIKISHEDISAIENLIDKIQDNIDSYYVQKIGSVILDNNLDRYINYIVNSFEQKFDSIKIVIDCANGSAYNLISKIFSVLNCNYVVIANKPNGYNINDKVGSEYSGNITKAVLQNSADIGIALDGDGDRVIICDEQGKVFSGENIIAALFVYFTKYKNINIESIVLSKLSNYGLDKFLKSFGCKVIRCDVGDYNVYNKILHNNSFLGGEPSGHIIINNYLKCSDAIFVAIIILDYVIRSKLATSQAMNLFTSFSQVNTKIFVKDKIITNKFINSNSFKKKIDGFNKNSNNIVVRLSGTEPYLRIMVEHEQQEIAQNIIDNIVAIVEKELC